MAENSMKQVTIKNKRSETAKIIADLVGRTPRLVRMVINEGSVTNDPILTAAVVYEQKIKEAREAARIAYEQAKNPLLKEVEDTVPFN